MSRWSSVGMSVNEVCFRLITGCETKAFDDSESFISAVIFIVAIVVMLRLVINCFLGDVTT